MDDQRFDALTRALARGSSRRTALKGLFGGVIGGMALATRLDRAGAQGQCASSADCLSDLCTSYECVEGQCARLSGCETGQTCCVLSGTCIDAGQCCENADCFGECEVCDPGSQTCVSACGEDEECCGVECVPLGQCAHLCIPAGNTCAGELLECCGDLQCCGFNGDSYCGACCSDSECPGECQRCIEGTCGSMCGQDQECCGDVCVPLGQCAHLCIPEGDTCAGELLECCPGFQCCEVDGGSSCQKCCGDSDCGPCAYCSEGVCYGECSQSERCCNGQCVEDEECCTVEGSICGVIPTGESSEPLDCCDGLVCCDNLYYGASVCAECCFDADCAKDGWCDTGECNYPHTCKDDTHCPKGTCCCQDGSCSGKCCHHPHPPKPPKPAPPAPEKPVSTLPATGAGPNDERNGLLGATALGAAAALYAAKQLRDDRGMSEAPIEEE